MMQKENGSYPTEEDFREKGLVILSDFAEDISLLLKSKRLNDEEKLLKTKEIFSKYATIMDKLEELSALSAKFKKQLKESKE